MFLKFGFGRASQDACIETDVVQCQGSSYLISKTIRPCISKNISKRLFKLLFIR